MRFNVRVFRLLLLVELVLVQRLFRPLLEKNVDFTRIIRGARVATLVDEPPETLVNTQVWNWPLLICNAQFNLGNERLQLVHFLLSTPKKFWLVQFDFGGAQKAMVHGVHHILYKRGANKLKHCFAHACVAHVEAANVKVVQLLVLVRVLHVALEPVIVLVDEFCEFVVQVLHFFAPKLWVVVLSTKVNGKCAVLFFASTRITLELFESFGLLRFRVDANNAHRIGCIHSLVKFGSRLCCGTSNEVLGLPSLVEHGVAQKGAVGLNVV